MQDKKKEELSWNPPEPPWKPEPKPFLPVKATPEPEPEAEEPDEFDLEGNPVLSEYVEEYPSAKAELIDSPGLRQYTVRCPTGITINGKVFAAGVHLVDEGIYETLSTLDAPYK